MNPDPPRPAKRLAAQKHMGGARVQQEHPVAGAQHVSGERLHEASLPSNTSPILVERRRPDQSEHPQIHNEIVDAAACKAAGAPAHAVLTTL